MNLRRALALVLLVLVTVLAVTQAPVRPAKPNRLASHAAAPPSRTLAPTTTSTTTIPQPSHPPSAVTVLVVNSTTVPQAASNISTYLAKSKGYRTLPATNSSRFFPSTVVYYEPGYASDAQYLAYLLGIRVANAMPLPSSPPVQPGQANLLVILGPDVAGHSASLAAPYIPTKS
jgi:hypothetical protein